MEETDRTQSLCGAEDSLTPDRQGVPSPVFRPGTSAYWVPITKSVSEYPEGTRLREKSSGKTWVRETYGWTSYDGVFTRDDPTSATHVFVPAIPKQWFCGVEYHRHQQESSAQNCIDKRLALGMKVAAQLAERRAKAPDISEPFDWLSVRARNCLMNDGLYTIEDIRRAVASKTLSRTPNLGEGTLREIEYWLAILPSGS